MLLSGFEATKLVKESQEIPVPIFMTIRIGGACGANLLRRWNHLNHPATLRRLLQGGCLRRSHFKCLRASGRPEVVTDTFIRPCRGKCRVKLHYFALLQVYRCASETSASHKRRKTCSRLQLYPEAETFVLGHKKYKRHFTLSKTLPMISKFPPSWQNFQDS